MMSFPVFFACFSMLVSYVLEILLYLFIYFNEGLNLMTVKMLCCNISINVFKHYSNVK